jgi:hypothetical protein
MRLAVALASLLAVAASPDGCGSVQPGYDPCAGKACGDGCVLCAPGDRDCVETAVLKVCDPSGRCVASATPFACPVPDPCAAKSCGEECLVSLPCHFSNPPCLAPQGLGHCDVTGACVPGDAGPCTPHPDCRGKACGDPCNPCGPVEVCPTLIPSACDRFGRCAGKTDWLCYDPCDGKACGEDCRICPPDAKDCAETLELKACDAAGRCVSRTPDLVCP